MWVGTTYTLKEAIQNPSVSEIWIRANITFGTEWPTPGMVLNRDLKIQGFVEGCGALTPPPSRSLALPERRAFRPLQQRLGQAFRVARRRGGSAKRGIRV